MHYQSFNDRMLKKLQNHKVNGDYMLTRPDGMGIWLAVFDNHGDVAGSISKRPDLMPLLDLLEEKGDEIFATADSVVLEVDLDKELVKKVLNDTLSSGATEWNQMKSGVKDALSKYLYTKTKRKPMILPVIKYI